MYSQVPWDRDTDISRGALACCPRLVTQLKTTRTRGITPNHATAFSLLPPSGLTSMHPSDLTLWITSSGKPTLMSDDPLWFPRLPLNSFIPIAAVNTLCGSPGVLSLPLDCQAPGRAERCVLSLLCPCPQPRPRGLGPAWFSPGAAARSSS